MKNADDASMFLRGEIDAEQYWHESGQQQVRSAGVLLTEQQQVRVCKHLARLAAAIRQQVPASLWIDSSLDAALDAVFDLYQQAVDAPASQYAFDDYLASLR